MHVMPPRDPAGRRLGGSREISFPHVRALPRRTGRGRTRPGRACTGGRRCDRAVELRLPETKPFCSFSFGIDSFQRCCFLILPGCG